jgi:hypothetical protein
MFNDKKTSDKNLEWGCLFKKYNISLIYKIPLLEPVFNNQALATLAAGSRQAGSVGNRHHKRVPGPDSI